MKHAMKILTLILAALAASVAGAAAALPSLPQLPAVAPALDVPVAVLMRPAPALSLTLPGGRQLTFATTALTPMAGVSAIRGRSPSGNDRLSVVATGGRILSGDVYATGGHYRLVSAGAGYH